MLRNFFQLNGSPVEYDNEQRLLDHFKTSNELANVVYTARKIEPPGSTARFGDRKFTNCLFKRTVIARVKFTRCKFEDCLFLGTRFIECEFHDCEFFGCNPYQASFDRCYIDPAMFERMLDPTAHSNIGVKLFHELLENSIKTHQTEFASTAEFNFRLWQRYQLTYKYRNKRISFRKYLGRWTPNIAYYIFCGYGLRARYFLTWAFLSVFLISLINWEFWRNFGIVNHGGQLAHGSFIEAPYFSIITLTTLGGDYSPAKGAGMLAVMAESIFGILLLGVLASILIRRIVR